MPKRFFSLLFNFFFLLAFVHPQTRTENTDTQIYTPREDKHREGMLPEEITGVIDAERAAQAAASNASASQQAPAPSTEISISDAQSGQPIDRNSVLAFEEFSWGVRAFHNGYYNSALVNFEKALGFVPKNALYRLWLGFANYYAGLEESALAQWETVINEDVAGYWLQSRVDTMLFRNSPYYDNLSQDTWAERGETAGRTGRILRFLRPTSVVADKLSGGAYVASYGTNTVAKFDVNGSVLVRYSGGLVQFDGPWDVLPLDDGRFFVTEFRSKRVSLMSRNGFRLKTFGALPNEGGLTSPQYLAATEDGYLYVTDWATKRVLKYDFNGKFIMSIGEPSALFEGLGRPGGIAASPTELFVVDADRRCIRVFDHYGNYLYELGHGELNAPEGLRLRKGKYLIIADGKRVIEANIEDRTFIPITDLVGKAENIMQTAFDANGALLVTDNKTNRLVYLSRLSSIYGGLSVEIRRIMSDQFPHVVMEVAVQSRSGDPVVGLQPGNFLLYDNGNPVADFKLGSYDNEPSIPIQASLMVEASPEALSMVDLFTHGIGQLNQAVLGKGNLKTFWISESPMEDTVFTGFDNIEGYQKKMSNIISPNWRFDAGLRMAASALLPRAGKQAVFFLTTGTQNGYAFNQYQPAELATYLKNNGIMFFPVYVTPSQRNEFYDLISRETGGYSLYLYRPQGLNGVIDAVKKVPTGVYTISYNSHESDDFGRSYITTDLEVVLQKESGKTVSGYFAPLR